MAVTVYTQAQLETLKYRELQNLAKVLQLKANGSKDILVARLTEHYNSLAVAVTPASPDCSDVVVPNDVVPPKTPSKSQPLPQEKTTKRQAARLEDTWSKWNPEGTRGRSPRKNPLHVEHTVEWNPNAVEDRHFKHRDQARHAYAQMYHTLHRRARSIPPFHHEEAEPGTSTSSEEESQPGVPEGAIHDNSAAQKNKPEAHLCKAKTTSDISKAQGGNTAAGQDASITMEGSPARVPDTETPNSTPKPRARFATPDFSPRSSSPSLFSQLDSQTTALTSQPVEPSQAATEVSSQDPWPSYGLSQRASQDVYESQDTAISHTAGVPESQPAVGSVEAISLTQLLQSPQPQQEDDLSDEEVDELADDDDVVGSSQLVEARVADKRTIQRIVEATVATCKANLSQAQLAINAYDEAKLRGVLDDVVRGAASTGMDHVKETSGSAPDNSGEATTKEPLRKRGRDDSEEPTLEANKRQRL